MKKLLLLLCLCSSAHAGTDVALFKDPNRNLNILEHSFFYKTKYLDFYGFNEFYRNEDLGFPQNKNVWFGKTWFMHNISDKWSIGFEIEHGRNNAGMFTTNQPFQQDKVFVLPKVGVKYKLH